MFREDLRLHVLKRKKWGRVWGMMGLRPQDVSVLSGVWDPSVQRPNHTWGTEAREQARVCSRWSQELELT